MQRKPVGVDLQADEVLANSGQDPDDGLVVVGHILADIVYLQRAPRTGRLSGKRLVTYLHRRSCQQAQHTSIAGTLHPAVVISVHVLPCGRYGLSVGLVDDYFGVVLLVGAGLWVKDEVGSCHGRVARRVIHRYDRLPHNVGGIVRDEHNDVKVTVVGRVHLQRQRETVRCTRLHTAQGGSIDGVVGRGHQHRGSRGGLSTVVDTVCQQRILSPVSGLGGNVVHADIFARVVGWRVDNVVGYPASDKRAVGIGEPDGYVVDTRCCGCGNLVVQRVRRVYIGA